jgi:hypothetical protein
MYFGRIGVVNDALMFDALKLDFIPKLELYINIFEIITLKKNQFEEVFNDNATLNYVHGGKVIKIKISKSKAKHFPSQIIYTV